MERDCEEERRFSPPARPADQIETLESQQKRMLLKPNLQSPVTHTSSHEAFLPTETIPTLKATYTSPMGTYYVFFDEKTMLLQLSKKQLLP